MRVAITGVAGVIGSTLHKSLTESGIEVIGIDLENPQSQFSSHQLDTKAISIFCDLSKPLSELEKNNPFNGCTHVVHLAGLGSPTATFEQLLPHNMVSVYNVCELSKKTKTVKRVIFASTNHTQTGMTMGNSIEVLDPSLLPNGFASIDINTPLTPDSLYAVTKIYGEALGNYYSKIEKAFDFVALRIGWITYDDPSALKGTSASQYLRSMWLSRRDCIGFFKAALSVSVPENFLVAYAVSNNGQRIYDLKETINTLGYTPQDDSDTYFS